MDFRYFVLALVGYSPEKVIGGRTLLQKLAYFVNDKIGLGVPFRPYYYGPYSEEVAAATQSLVASGFLEEREDLFPQASSDVFERRRYTYRLTEDGGKVLGRLEEDLTVLCDVKLAVQRVTTREQCDYECLSIAAKTHHILKAGGRPMKGRELMEVGKELGWDISEDQLRKAAEFLVALGIIREAD